MPLDGIGGGKNRFGIRNVGGRNEGHAAEFLHLLFHLIQRVLIARDQPDLAPGAAEPVGDCAPYSSGCTRDHGGPILQIVRHTLAFTLL
jgi:hypothetical protein